MKSIKVCEYSGSRSFHDDLLLQDQASGERSQDQWFSGFLSSSNFYLFFLFFFFFFHFFFLKSEIHSQKLNHLEVNVYSEVIILF